MNNIGFIGDDLSASQLYLNYVNESFQKRMSSEEKCLTDLVEFACKGDIFSRNELISMHQKEIWDVAKKLAYVFEDVMDQVQVANEFLLDMFEKYDSKDKNNFSNFVYAIANYSKYRNAGDSKFSITIPRYLLEAYGSIKLIQGHYVSGKSVFEISQELNLSEALVKNYLFAYDCMTTISLNDDFLNSNECDSCLHSDYYCPVKSILDFEKKSLLYKTLDDTLTDLEKDVIIYRFGMYDGNEYTQNETAIFISKSRSRVQQLEASAIKKLRKNMIKNKN